jgi:hypothetical protein
MPLHIDNMEQIKYLLNNFFELSHKYSHKESIKALKKHYCDICSNGDIIINKLINFLDIDINNNNITNNILQYRNSYTDKEYFNDVVENLNKTIKEFNKNGLTPNQFWAN